MLCGPWARSRRREGIPSLTGGNADLDTEVFLFDGATIDQISTSAGTNEEPSLDADAIAFRSSSDLTGGNPDGNAEIFLATCVGSPAPSEIPVAGPAGLVMLSLLLLAAGLATLRRALP